MTFDKKKQYFLDMNKYTVTINESETGMFRVTSVKKAVAINQHRTDTRNLPAGTFAFADASNPRSLTARAATKKTAKR